MFDPGFWITIEAPGSGLLTDRFRDDELCPSDKHVIDHSVRAPEAVPVDVALGRSDAAGESCPYLESLINPNSLRHGI